MHEPLTTTDENSIASSRLLRQLIQRDLIRFPDHAQDSPRQRAWRLGGFRSAIVRGVVENTHWGTSMFHRRGGKVRGEQIKTYGWNT